MVVTCAVAGVIVFLLRSGSLQSRLTYAAIAVVICALLYPLMARGARERRLRKLLRERFGGDGPFSFEIELTPAGVTTVQAGTRTERPWSTFVAVEDTPDSIDLIVKGAGSVVVRNRAFNTPEQRMQFLELARSYLAAQSK